MRDLKSLIYFIRTSKLGNQRMTTVIIYAFTGRSGRFLKDILNYLILEINLH